jgi:N-methylhydantoinase B/oxoprolinase/acetone carboxylase alpha subunit
MATFETIPPQTDVDGDVALQAEVEEFLHSTKLFRGPDPEIMRDHRPAPRTRLEEQAIAAGADDLTRTIVRNKLQVSANESKDMLMHIASAPAAKWGDLIAGVFTASGDLAVASSSGVLLFSVLAAPPIKYILKNWRDEPTVGVRDGDIFMHNDARFGNVHNTDQSCLLPVFHEGELVAWVGTIIHEGENGSTEPGGMPSAAESPYDEGLKISPMKIGENFQLREDLVTYFQNSVRDPKLQLEDMRARLAGTLRLRQRVLEAIAEYGRDAVVGVLRDTLEFTSAEVRRRLAALPDGKTSIVRFCDNTLREPVMLKINCSVEIRGDEMWIDLRGSGPEIMNRAINTVLASLKGMIAQVFLSFIWPDLPRNQAAFEPVHVITDERSAFDCSPEVPNAVSMMTFFPAFSAVEQLLQTFLFNNHAAGNPAKATEVHATWWNMISGFLYGGYTQHGYFVGNVMTDINGMGGGARTNRDGEHSLAPIFCAMADLGEIELIEDEIALVGLTYRRLMRDNQGFGRYRGGHGHLQVATYQNSPLWGWQTITIGSKFPQAFGLFGGYGSPCYPLMKVKGVDALEAMRADSSITVTDPVAVMNERPFADADYTTSHTGLQFELAAPGELYMASQGTGGGYGDVLEREPEAVVRDMRRGLISEWTARHIYAVAADPDTFALDLNETERLRTEKRAERLTNGVPFAEFEATWTTKTPPEGMPYYGCWDDPAVIYAGNPATTMPAEAIQAVMMM